MEVTTTSSPAFSHSLTRSWLLNLLERRNISPLIPTRGLRGSSGSMRDLKSGVACRRISSKPSFFGYLQWPPIGPDLYPKVGLIPAYNRFYYPNEGLSAPKHLMIKWQLIASPKGLEPYKKADLSIFMLFRENLFKSSLSKTMKVREVKVCVGVM